MELVADLLKCWKMRICSTLLHLLWTFAHFYHNACLKKISSRSLSGKSYLHDVFIDHSRDPSVETGRLNLNEYEGDRKALPTGVLKYKANLDELECGQSYDVREEKYITFTFDSPQKICNYDFLGSKANGCTVAIICKGKGTFGRKTSKGCDDNAFIMLHDAMDGKIMLCGDFDFDDVPRRARNNATDLYLSFIGVSKAATCVVFCIEDVKHKEPKMSKLKPIPQIKHYKGLTVGDRCVCGRRQTFGRIVGGENALKFEFPWMVAIVRNQPNIKRAAFCGGTLINDRYVVSAAHCFQSKTLKLQSIQVLLHAHLLDKYIPPNDDVDDPKYDGIPGWNEKDATDDTEQSVRVGVEKIIVHRLFDPKSFDFDIALLKLKDRINFKKGTVLPACLPNLHKTYNYFSHPFTVSGWGFYKEGLEAGVRKLQKLDVPYETLEICRANGYAQATSRHICAGYPEGFKDACNGDSGGPLIHRTSKKYNQYMLAGVVSSGRGCARQGSLGLYTNVQEVLQWIYSKTQDAYWCASNP